MNLKTQVKGLESQVKELLTLDLKATKGQSYIRPLAVMNVKSGEVPRTDKEALNEAVNYTPNAAYWLNVGKQFARVYNGRK